MQSMLTKSEMDPNTNGRNFNMANTYTSEKPDIFAAINMIISDNFADYVMPEEFRTLSVGKNDTLLSDLMDILHIDYGFTREFLTWNQTEIKLIAAFRATAWLDLYEKSMEDHSYTGGDPLTVHVVL